MTGSKERTVTEPAEPLSSRRLGGTPVGVRVLRNDARAELPGRVAPNSLRIGSDTTCDLRIVDDPYVSALHCELTVDAGDMYVRDLGSKNGTKANGVIIRRACITPVGTLITVGHTTLVVYGRGAVDFDGPGLATFVRRAVRDYGSIRKAAKAIGVPYATLSRWLKREAPGRGRKR